MNRNIVLFIILVVVASCDKVCQHPTLKQMVMSNYVDSSCTSAIIKRYDSGSNFTKFVDSSQITISSPTANYVFTEIYDYLIIFKPVSKVCKIKNLKFAMDLGPGSSSTPCYSSYSYTTNDSAIWVNEKKSEGYISVKY